MACVKPEAEYIAEKHRGQMGSFLNQDGNRNYSSPRPEARVTSASREYYERNKGVIDDCMEGHRAPPIDRKIHPRGVTDDGASMSRMSKGGRMEKLVTYQGSRMPDTSRGASRSVKPEAEEFAERNKGVMGKVLHDYGSKPRSTRDPKVSGPGMEFAEKGQGKGMGPILRQDNPLPHKDPSLAKPGRLHGDTENWIAPSPRVYKPLPPPEPRQGPLHKDSENWIQHNPSNARGMAPKMQQNKFWQPSENWPADRNLGVFSSRDARYDPMYEKSDGWMG